MEGIGIDLGNSITRVASVDKDSGKVSLFEYDGENSFPSYVYVNEDGNFIVGKAAKEQQKNHPKNTIFNIKQFLGADYDKCVSTGVLLPFLLVQEKKEVAVQCETKAGKIVLKVGDLLKQIFIKAASHPNAENKKFVITYPPYLSPAQREVIRSAAKAAGVTVDSMVVDPLAAIAAYEDQFGPGKHTVLVFDCGQTDTVVSIFKGNNNNYKQLCTVVDSVGGDDINYSAGSFLSREFRATYRKNLSRDERGMKLLRDAIEVAKKELRGNNEIELNIPGIVEGVDYKDVISREKFDYITEDVYDRAAGQINAALELAKITEKDLTHVILSGGSSKLESMKATVKAVTAKEPFDTIDPQNVVAIGAAKLASKL
jgi:molecular chaperone DnaK